MALVDKDKMNALLKRGCWPLRISNILVFGDGQNVRVMLYGYSQGKECGFRVDVSKKTFDEQKQKREKLILRQLIKNMTS